MTNKWLLPDHIADVLPTKARHIEETRRALLDVGHRYGYELVIPPLVEHLDSLLVGSGAPASESLDLQTFKLVDQHSGRTLGVRADTTPQVARIDAHILNRQGLTRLCYCGPVLHTRPSSALASREPLQFGAEIYGHAGIEADLEVMELALTSLRIGGVAHTFIDLAHVEIVESFLRPHKVNAVDRANIYRALAIKDGLELMAATQAANLDTHVQQALKKLLRLYGGVEVIEQARTELPITQTLTHALDQLEQMVRHLYTCGVQAERIRIDLADLGGYGYYSGIRFVLYSPLGKDALARGGRYDDVGVAFGRKRPAVGFSLDVKTLVDTRPLLNSKGAICMPWSHDLSLRAAASELREKGETVICVLPGHEYETQEFACDRELVKVDGAWIVKNR